MYNDILCFQIQSKQKKCHRIKISGSSAICEVILRKAHLLKKTPTIIYVDKICYIYGVEMEVLQFAIFRQCKKLKEAFRKSDYIKS